ncbi:MAG: tRNA (adenosine(37)-N6)-dimethylallyltransferase MiaA [Kiritimatiellia bacterium]|jgi:tRNA dimethylallyltransferase
MNTAAVSGRGAWILVGPTATGKTAVANELARRMDAVVLSADSMLVYRGMDIGTAKPTPEERHGIPFYGIDLADPCENFSVGAWLESARAAFADAEARGRDVIVAGGTGLYVNALLRGLDAPAADPALRKRLEALAREGGAEALRRRAESLHPGATARLPDPENPRRLVRLVERLSAGAAPGGAGLACRGRVVAGLAITPGVLSARITARIESMFKVGLLDEVAALRETWPEFSATAGMGIGYAEAAAVLDGALTRQDAAEQIARRTRQLAKRQRTWFRTQLDVEWAAGPADAADVAHAADDVLEIWKRRGKTPVAV